MQMAHIYIYVVATLVKYFRSFVSNMLCLCIVFSGLCIVFWGFVQSLGALYNLLGVSRPQSIPPPPPQANRPPPPLWGLGPPAGCAMRA